MPLDLLLVYCSLIAASLGLRPDSMLAVVEIMAGLIHHYLGVVLSHEIVSGIRRVIDFAVRSSIVGIFLMSHFLNCWITDQGLAEILRPCELRKCGIVFMLPEIDIISENSKRILGETWLHLFWKLVLASSCASIRGAPVLLIGQ